MLLSWLSVLQNSSMCNCLQPKVVLTISSSKVQGLILTTPSHKLTIKAIPPIKAPIPTTAVCTGAAPPSMPLAPAPWPVLLASGGAPSESVTVAAAAVALDSDASTALSCDCSRDAADPVAADDSSDDSDATIGAAAEVMLAMIAAASPVASATADEASETMPPMAEVAPFTAEPMLPMRSRLGSAGAGRMGSAWFGEE